MIESVNEKKIIENYVQMMANYISECNDILSLSEDAEELELPSTPYWQIVQQLLLWGTTHSGRTSSMEKCIELGLDPDERPFLKLVEPYDLNSDFDVKWHKKTFINYLEVIIHENGSVHYATPSHQEYLINYACRLLECDRKTLNDMCPREYYGDFLMWLCMITKCVSVWSCGFIYHTLSDEQKETLQMLIDEELTIGEIK